MKEAVAPCILYSVMLYKQSATDEVMLFDSYYSCFPVLLNDNYLSEFLSEDDGRDLVFEQLPFSAPLYILYSSGTSGPPKCIVHTAGVRRYLILICVDRAPIHSLKGCVDASQERDFCGLWNEQR